MADKLLKRIDFLSDVPLFAEVNDSALAHIANDFRERPYRKGTTIFNQDDRSRHFYVILKGKVRVYHLTRGGKETTVNIFGPRQLVGEFSFVDELPRSAFAEAITDCVLLEMSGDTGIHHMTHVPALALSMCRQITKKVRWTTMYAETVSRLDAPGRLLHFLLEFNDQFGQEIEPGHRYVVDLGLNQSDLATLIGVDRPWLNKLLQGWRKRELIEFNRGEITILDLPRVEEARDSHMDPIIEEEDDDE